MLVTHSPKPISGRDLRYLLTTYLAAAGPLTVARLVGLLERDGFELRGRPSKEVSDALRWEIARGRVVKISRATYAAKAIPERTARRIRTRARQLAP
ncbi:hypothetical protein [Aquihabitans sp. McL0605]|uniref:hypothetical protein n=1 Tax=Aquihabitans sp. McL0605 TaxID=3415671 RepID=UPI003CEFDFE2